MSLTSWTSAPNAQQIRYGYPVRSLLEARSEAVLLQGWDLSCGAAALATVLRFRYGVDVSERLVAEAMLRIGDAEAIRRQGGFSFLDLKRFAQSLGFHAEGLKLANVGELRRYKHAIIPILESGRQQHFIVVRAYTPAGDFDIGDPAFGNRRVSDDDLEELWTSKVALILEPR